MSEKKKTPALRFDGFTDDWEQRKLGNYIIEYTETTKTNNQYPVLTSSRKGIFFQKDYYNGNQVASDDNTGYNIVPYGYFTYRHMSDDEIFHFNINDIAENGIVSTLYPVFTTDSNLDSRYLQYQLNYGYEFKKFANLQKQGGSRTYMYLSKLKQLDITIPKSIEEQVQISEYLVKLDNLITLHQRKCDKLKNLKKSCLEKMFPKNGETLPEVRFEGFTDDWEQRKFGEIVDKYEDPVPTPHNGYTRLGIRSHAKGTFHSYVEAGKELETAKMHRVASGNFIVNITFGWEHAVAITNENDAGKLVSHRFPQFKFAENMNPNFFRYVVTDENFRHHLWLASPGGAGRNRVLKISEMLEYLMNYPSKNEQDVISHFFMQLDNLITLHQRKVEKLQNIKKSMLEKMFV